MGKQAKKSTEKATTTSDKKTSLGKRKKSEDEYNLGDSDDLKMSEARKKIQKVTHSNMIERESVEKSELTLDSSFVQLKTTCGCGKYHTITLADDETAYSFGKNGEGELGLGHNDDVSLPTPIPNLPKINMVSCGAFFTVCADHEGFIWSFGLNNFGQLGTGNSTNFNVPQKLINIPPALSVSCGYNHTLMITNDDNLWSWGVNTDGQLCHGDRENRSVPQKTSFSNIVKTSTGSDHSLFQNNKGEIFACGNNGEGQCGLGHFNDPQITPSLIPSAPSDIVHFVCGFQQNLFLDSEGNVFSVGFNGHGQLGLGHNTNQNVLSKIPNIPPIKIISCVGLSCYLIDFEGNLWFFGNDPHIQMFSQKYKNNPIPKIVDTLEDIQQISYGSCGEHFLAKNSQNTIFITGHSSDRQFVMVDSKLDLEDPKEVKSQYSAIWRDEFRSRAKSARK